MRRSRLLGSLVGLAVLCAATASAAHAQDKLKLAVGQRGVWETAISEIGQDAGIFKKHGLSLEIIYTQGTGETQQVVISGAAVSGISVGTFGAMGAFAKGAPVRVIGSTMTGGNDLLWYVVTNSPIKTMNDTAGKTVAYSTNGSSTQQTVLAFGKHLMDEGKIRVIAKAGDIPRSRDQTIRIVLANADALKSRRDVFVRYVRAYRDTLDWMYSDPAAVTA